MRTAVTTITGRVRQDAAAVASAATHVAIDGERLRALAERFVDARVPAWDGELHFFDGGPKSVMYTLLLDAVNFCFWPSRFIVEHGGKRYGDDDGYCALAVALKRAFEDGMPLWDPSFLRRLTVDELGEVLRCVEGGVPLFEERLANARDVGETLAARYGGDPLALMARARGDAAAFVAELAANFRAYRDVRTYAGREVLILKRAQLCASDLIGSFNGQGPGALSGGDDLTCFADYKLPQLFHADGVFVYEESLDLAVRAGRPIAEGSPEEVEIRSATIEAVERMKAVLAAKGRALSSREIDWLLWNESIVPGRLTVPHHRTITTSY